MKKTIFLAGSIMAILFMVGFWLLNKFNGPYYEDIRPILNTFADYVDDISNNKIQLNWQEIIAVSAIRNDVDIKNLTANHIEETDSMFLSKDSNNAYSLLNIEQVMMELDFMENDKTKVYNKISELQGIQTNYSSEELESMYIQFIYAIKDGAIENYKKYNILPSITISQAILESSWGQSVLASDHNNLFGIKADNSWDGESIAMETMEYSDTYITDEFRKYPDKIESILDHGRFLVENKRYTEAGLFNGNTYQVQAQSLEDAGYATVVNDNGERIYADRLIEIIKQYHLQLLDNQVQKELNP